jgi:hypothetical protein
MQQFEEKYYQFNPKPKKGFFDFLKIKTKQSV